MKLDRRLGAGGRGKGKPLTRKWKRENAKPKTFTPKLANIHTAHAQANDTKQNDFPVELSPPISTLMVACENRYCIWGPTSGFIVQTQSEIWFEMGTYGSVRAHIKPGRRPMTQHHFCTPSGLHYLTALKP